MCGMKQPAAILNAAVGAGFRNLYFNLEVEVLHDRAGADVMNVMLPGSLRRVGVNRAVLDRPHVGFAVPTIERLAVPQFCKTGVVVIRDRCRAASQSTPATASTAIALSTSALGLLPTLT